MCYSDFKNAFIEYKYLSLSKCDKYVCPYVTVDDFISQIDKLPVK